MTVVYLERKTVFAALVATAVVFALGILVGHLSTKGGGENESARTGRQLREDLMSNVVDSALAAVDPMRIRSYHEFLTKEPHIAALRRDKELVDWIVDRWKTFGLDRVELAEYDVYLSWPNQTNPNKIRLLDGSGNIQFTSAHKEAEVRQGDDHPDFVHAFNGYAPAADLEVNLKDLVFVHYGTVEDMRQLEDMGISVKGKICIARYGRIFRGNKVKNCQDRGGIGAILYSDPSDVAIYGTGADQVYPNSIFLPGTGMQRGSIATGFGDPLSPRYPSVENAYRYEPENVDVLPKIPSQPIGYDDASEILSKLGGQEVPTAWKGGIENVTYSLGNAENPDYPGWKLQLKTNNMFDTKKDANIIGYIKGAVEPDRYVILGNHRDAWGYGAADPSSGTATLMEIAQVLGNLAKSGWRPRRTIVFGSWAAEEYGLIGSYEWVEDKRHKLMERAVSVINVDTCSTGPISKSTAAPSLKSLLIEAHRHAYDLESEGNTDKSYYDYWLDWHNLPEGSVPDVAQQSAASDDTGFAFYAGIPGFNLRFRPDSKKYGGMNRNPSYHTGYETFYLIDKLIDPGYKINRACVQTSLFMLLQLAESRILPLDLSGVAAAMEHGLNQYKEDGTVELMEANNATVRYLEDAIEAFKDAALAFMERKEEAIRSNDPLEGRIFNDQLMLLDRAFIIPEGLPDRPADRHAIFAPSKYNKYGSSSFPGIADLTHEIEKLGDEERAERWERVRRHLSDLMIIVRSAASFLQPVDEI